MSRKKNRPLPQSLALPPVGVDSHAHLDLPEFASDLPEVMSRARASGVSRIGNVFLGPAAYLSGKELFDQSGEVFFLLGIHPNHSVQAFSEQIEEMAGYFALDGRLRALGEIGLDYYRQHSDPAIQQDFFRRQLDLARELSLPVVIHCREAFADTVEILDDMGFADRPLLWHCFGGDSYQLQEILQRGWHVSIPGPVTYKGNDDVRRAVAVCPLDRILLETDAPFLAPEPWRGKRNEPAFTAFTAAAVAAIRGMDTETLWRRSGENACLFFGLED